MPIINRVIPYLHNEGIEQRAQNTIFQMSEFKDYNYYWVEYGNDKSLKHLPEVLTETILDDIKQGKLILSLYNSHEASINVVDPIYKHAVIDLGIPEEFVHIYTESPTLKQVIPNVAKKYKKKILKCFNVFMFERMAKDDITHLKLNSKREFITLENKKYVKKFLNFNRRWRTQRPCFVAHLFLENILDLGYVSLAKSDDSRDWESVWNSMLHTHSHHLSLLQKFLDNKDKIFSIPELYLDQKDLTINRANLLLSTEQLYRDTYFSVVSETNFFYSEEPAVFLTEKIFKPIAHKHPFIVISRPKTLSLLKDLGYKTFENIIDESYDNENDDVTRMMMVLEETKRLCYLSDNELETFLEKARTICNYNYQVLMSKTNFVREITNDSRY